MAMAPSVTGLRVIIHPYDFVIEISVSFGVY